MFKNILLATDGSDHAKRAAEVAADIAKVYGARLTIIHVRSLSLTLEDLRSMPQAKRFSKNVLADIKRLRDVLRQPTEEGVLLSYVPAPYSAIKALGEEILNDAEKIAKKRKVAKIARVAVDGNPAQQILAQSKRSKADLIVVGSRGLTRAGELILGSVSHKVIHMAACPCLVVK